MANVSRCTIRVGPNWRAAGRSHPQLYGEDLRGPFELALDLHPGQVGAPVGTDGDVAELGVLVGAADQLRRRAVERSLLQRRARMRAW